MKKFIILLYLVCGIISCSEVKTNESVENVDSEVTIDCSYEDSEDITDEFLAMRDEIIEKDINYNQARYDDNITKWEGMGVYLKDVLIIGISKKKSDLLLPKISISLGKRQIGYSDWVRFDIMILFEDDSEIIDYDVDEIVDIKGVVGRGFISEYDPHYNVNLTCVEIIKK